MKLTPSARNPPVPPSQTQVGHGHGTPSHTALNCLPSLPFILQVPPAQQDVTADNHPSQQLLASLTQSTPQQQKQIIGEHLYREIYGMHADLAGKITGRERYKMCHCQIFTSHCPMVS